MAVIFGTDGDDVLNGTPDGDSIFRAGGDDLISGGAGNDALGGNDGDDQVLGDNGDDSCPARGAATSSMAVLARTPLPSSHSRTIPTPSGSVPHRRVMDGR
jgi:Ca2+-binding RTX toxin-like protein